jgi:hypothetical protein
LLRVKPATSAFHRKGEDLSVIDEVVVENTSLRPWTVRRLPLLERLGDVAVDDRRVCRPRAAAAGDRPQGRP